MKVVSVQIHDWRGSVKQLEQVRRVFGDSIGDNHPSIHAWSVYHVQARRRKVEFALDRVEFTDLLTDHCFYCGAEPKPIHGIDRVDNTKGYVRGNVVTACDMCNTAKNNHSLADFTNWAIRVGSNLFRWQH